jgi:hypothetical protein
MILSGAIVEFTETATLFLGCAGLGILVITVSWLFTDIKHIEKLENAKDATPVQLDQA